jgi:hypothetical protein
MTDKPQNAGLDVDIAPLCVICGIRSQTGKYRPFCSDGVYAIPGKAEEEEDETPGER